MSVQLMATYRSILSSNWLETVRSKVKVERISDRILYINMSVQFTATYRSILSSNWLEMVGSKVKLERISDRILYRNIEN